MATNTCSVGTSSAAMKQIPTPFPQGVNYKSEPPFTLNGRAYTTPPTGEPGLSEYKRKPDALTNTEQANRENYLRSDNYVRVDLQTQNIIGADPSTTLRYGSIKFSQKCIAYHKNLWDDTGVSVSLLFESEDGGTYFHICIPVELTSSGEDQNIFLKYWLNQNRLTNVPSNLTTNELLNFRKSSVKFYTIQYCLNLNSDKVSNSYILCKFQDSLKLDKTQLPAWLQTDPTMSKGGDNYKKTFSSIFNLVLRGKVQNLTAGFNDPPLLSLTDYFTTGQETTLKPIYYDVSSDKLTGKLFKQSFQAKPGKTLQNIKCYPIDLATQVNSDGTINVDEETNKPIPVDAIKGETSVFNPKDDLTAKKDQDRFIFMIAAILSFIVLLVVGIIVIVYVLNGRAVGSLPTPVSVVPTT
jgi:hypothetical protein